MLRKFMATAAAGFAMALVHSYSPPPAEAIPLDLDAAVASVAGSDAILVRRRWSLQDRPRQEGIAVFIIPGIYWGPAWWDPAYSRLCWKKIRPCRDCIENWILVC